MSSPNDELQRLEDEYFDQRFNEALRSIFSFQTVILIALLLLESASWTNAFRFYPSDWGTDVGLAMCAASTLWLTIVFISRPPKQGSAGTASRPGVVRPLGAALFLTVILAPFFFNFCLGLITAIMGTPGQQHAIEDSWQNRTGRGRCSGPLIQGLWIDRNIVCLDRHREREFPDGSHLTLTGKISPLGMNVEDAVPHW